MRLPSTKGAVIAPHGYAAVAIPICRRVVKEMEAGSSTARFQAVLPARRRARALLLLSGPVLWVLALVVLAYVLDRGDAVQFALAVFLAAFAAGLLLLSFARAMRGRDERQA